MTEGMTCYERDEELCEDGMCLRCGCRLANKRNSDMQRRTSKAKRIDLTIAFLGGALIGSLLQTIIIWIWGF